MKNEFPFLSKDKANLSIVILTITSSFLYLAKLTTFSPVYALSPVFFIYLITSFYISNKKIYIESCVFYSLAILIVYYTFNVMYFQAGISTFVNFTVGVTYFLSVILFLGLINRFIFVKGVVCSFWLIAIIFFFDSLHRFIFPKMPSEEAMAAVADTSNFFYMFKFNTLMFADSNTTAIACVSIFFTLLYLKRNNIYSSFILSFIYFSLIILTLSRAAIAATIICVILFSDFLSKKVKYFFIMFFLLLTPFLLFEIFENDDSLESRFYILSKFLNHIYNADEFTIFFGVGLDGSQKALDGIYAHVHFITSMVESGVFGLLLTLNFLILYLFSTRFKGLFIILPNIVLGFSYFFYLGSPLVFVPMAILYVLERRVHE